MPMEVDGIYLQPCSLSIAPSLQQTPAKAKALAPGLFKQVEIIYSKTVF